MLALGRHIAHGALPQSHVGKGGYVVRHALVDAEKADTGSSQPQGDELHLYDGAEYGYHLQAGEEAHQLQYTQGQTIAPFCHSQLSVRV